MVLEKIIIALAIIGSYFMQTSMDFLRLGDINPDLLLILTIYFAVYKGEFTGIWIGFFGGLLQDINLGASTAMGFDAIRHYLGMNILPKSICGYFAGKFSLKVRRDSILTIVGMVFAFSVLKGLLKYFLTAIFFSNTAAQTVITVILPESIYNSIISIVWFKALLWAIPPSNTKQ